MTAMNLNHLAKAIIINTENNERINVMYNPEQFTLDQGNDFVEIGIPGLNAPPIQYVRGKGRTLSMDLFFDTYELSTDVRQFTDPVVGLLNKMPDTRAPPVLLFVMGQFTFRCVLVEAGQRFSMFLRDGTPVRSTLSVRFHEYVEAEVAIEPGVFVGPPALFNVIQGQTVSDVAAQVFGDPSRWREIADANKILDPLFNLSPGQQLVIPRAPQK
jgi:hypothetical protein